MAEFMKGVRGALVLSWGTPRSGREPDALRYLEDTQKFFENRVAGGRIESPRLFICTAGNASELLGMLMVEGDIEEIFGLMFDSDFQSRMVRAAHLSENVTSQYFVVDSMAEGAKEVYGQGIAGLR